jgi:flagellar hook-basal body complex protein FliE
MPTSTAAANAYVALARLADPGRALAGPDGGRDTAGASFGSLLKTALGAVVDAGRKSDAQAQALAVGKANVVDVVTAVAETEVAIESMVAVRDRVIHAYEEIMKMPI